MTPKVPGAGGAAGGVLHQARPRALLHHLLPQLPRLRHLAEPVPRPRPDPAGDPDDDRALQITLYIVI